MKTSLSDTILINPDTLATATAQEWVFLCNEQGIPVKSLTVFPICVYGLDGELEVIEDHLNLMQLSYIELIAKH